MRGLIRERGRERERVASGRVQAEREESARDGARGTMLAIERERGRGRERDTMLLRDKQKVRESERVMNERIGETIGSCGR